MKNIILSYNISIAMDFNNRLVYVFIFILVTTLCMLFVIHIREIFNSRMVELATQVETLNREIIDQRETFKCPDCPMCPKPSCPQCSECKDLNQEVRSEIHQLYNSSEAGQQDKSSVDRFDKLPASEELCPMS